MNPNVPFCVSPWKVAVYLETQDLPVFGVEMDPVLGGRRRRHDRPHAVAVRVVRILPGADPASGNAGAGWVGCRMRCGTPFLGEQETPGGEQNCAGEDQRNPVGAERAGRYGGPGGFSGVPVSAGIMSDRPSGMALGYRNRTGWKNKKPARIGGPACRGPGNLTSPPAYFRTA